MIFCLCALSFDCGVFDVDGSVLDTEAGGGGGGVRRRVTTLAI